jgi:hypothetical protein
MPRRRAPSRRLTAERKRIHSKRQYVRNIKMQHPCMDCIIHYPYYVMQFDHVKGTKVQDISNMITSNRSMDTLKRELAKCELVCANCHAVRTHERRIARETTHGKQSLQQ